jgi:tRNA threonylcarbamoyladenosine biosynthesis protein TsaE
MTRAVVPLPTRRATIRLGRALGRALQGGDLLLLEGELGAGKTFLVRAIVRALGVPHATTVQSPTFALVHEYAARVPVVHADLYRLDDPLSLRELGLREKRAEGSVVLAEWALRFAAELGSDGLLITLTRDGAREARLEPRGPRGDQLLREAGL